MAVQELLSADLSVTGQLRAVDPGHVRAVLHALAPDLGTWGDAAVAGRVGRFFGAGIVVHGTLAADPDGSWVLLGALQPLVARANGIAFQALADEGAFYGLTKELALRLYEIAGIQLTPAQRREVENTAPVFVDLRGMEPTPSARTRVGRGQTQFAEAWMRFGQAVIALDAAAYADAERLFEEAFRIDQSFDLARARANRAAALGASAAPASDLAWQAAQVARQARAVGLIAGSPSRVEVVRALGPRERAGLAELLGEALGAGVLIELRFVPGDAP
jgi:hypothetical protein